MREPDAAKNNRLNAQYFPLSLLFGTWHLFLTQSNNGSLQYAVQAQAGRSTPVAVNIAGSDITQAGMSLCGHL